MHIFEKALNSIIRLISSGDKKFENAYLENT